jgi:hypothetical protein
MKLFALKISGVAAFAFGVMGCSHSHDHAEEPVVEEVVVVERPVATEVVTLDCTNPEHWVYKECTR